MGTTILKISIFTTIAISANASKITTNTLASSFLKSRNRRQTDASLVDDSCDCDQNTKKLRAKMLEKWCNEEVCSQEEYSEIVDVTFVDDGTVSARNLAAP